MACRCLTRSARAAAVRTIFLVLPLEKTIVMKQSSDPSDLGTSEMIRVIWSMVTMIL